MWPAICFCHHSDTGFVALPSCRCPPRSWMSPGSRNVLPFGSAPRGRLLDQTSTEKASHPDFQSLPHHASQALSRSRCVRDRYGAFRAWHSDHSTAGIHKSRIQDRRCWSSRSCPATFRNAPGAQSPARQPMTELTFKMGKSSRFVQNRELSGSFTICCYLPCRLPFLSIKHLHRSNR